MSRSRPFSVCLAAALAFLLAGCSGGSSQHPRSSPAEALIRSSDLPPGWTIESDALPPGVTMNNGGPIGRAQTPNCLETSNRPVLAAKVSQEFGDGTSRAWDLVATGSQSDISTAFNHLQNDPRCFIGVMETEAIKAYPDLSSQPFQLDYGKPTITPIDLGSYGNRTASQRVTTTFIHADQPKVVTLDVAMVETSGELLIFGFLSSGPPALSGSSEQVIQTVVSRQS